MFCIYCGVRNPEVAQFCANCGARMEKCPEPTQALSSAQEQAPGVLKTEARQSELPRDAELTQPLPLVPVDYSGGQELKEGSGGEGTEHNEHYQELLATYASSSDEMLERLVEERTELEDVALRALAATLRARGLPGVEAVENCKGIVPAVTEELFSPPRPPISPIYASLSLRLLAIVLLSSAGTFIIAEGRARGGGDGVIPAVLLGVTLLLLGLWTAPVWNSVAQTARQQPGQPKPIKLLAAAAVILVAASCVTVLWGKEIGERRRDAIQFNADIEKELELAGQISAARSKEVKTISEYSALLIGIKRDVEEYGRVVLRIQQECQSLDRMFPSQHASWQKTTETMNTEAKRVTLLRQEIAVAEEMGNLDEASQAKAWRSEMKPLLAAEDSLTR